jgi:hypothetical protein
VNRLGWGLAVALGIFVVAAVVGVVNAGPLDPPGGVPTTESTQENLIYQPTGACPAGFPIPISAPGSYRLAQNITGCPGVSGISIGASNVTLDLGGFAIIGTGGGTGITLSAAFSQITVTNGSITDWGTGAMEFAAASDAQISRIEARANGPVAGAGTGQIRLGSNSILEDCVVTLGVAAQGVTITGSGSGIDGCNVSNNGYQGIMSLGMNNRISNNHTVGNTTDLAGGCAGIWAAGSGTVIEGNSASGAGPQSCPIWTDASSGTVITRNYVTDVGLLGRGYYLGTPGQIVTENVATGVSGSADGGFYWSATGVLTGNIAHGGGAANFVNACACGDVGPIGTAAATTSPWANISD